MKGSRTVRIGLVAALILATNLYAVASAAAGGGPSAPGGQALLVGRQWRLVALRNAQGVLAPAVPGTHVTATFEPAGSVTGSGGCNNYHAGYTVSGVAIMFGPVASTFMYCAEPAGAMDQEQAFFAALADAATYRVGATSLALRTATGATAATFVAAAPGAKLTGVRWAWQSTLGTGGRRLAPAAPADYTVEFLPPDQVEIKADCNNAFGRYHTGPGRSLAITVLGTTAVACPPGSLGDAFLNQLGHAATYRVGEGTLNITLQAQAGTMKFTPAAS